MKTLSQNLFNSIAVLSIFASTATLAADAVLPQSADTQSVVCKIIQEKAEKDANLLVHKLGKILEKEQHVHEQKLKQALAQLKKQKAHTGKNLQEEACSYSTDLKKITSDLEAGIDSIASLKKRLKKNTDHLNSFYGDYIEYSAKFNKAASSTENKVSSYYSASQAFAFNSVATQNLSDSSKEIGDIRLPVLECALDVDVCGKTFGRQVAEGTVFEGMYCELRPDYDAIVDADHYEIWHAVRFTPKDLESTGDRLLFKDRYVQVALNQAGADCGNSKKAAAAVEKQAAELGLIDKGPLPGAEVSLEALFPDMVAQPVQ